MCSKRIGLPVSLTSLFPRHQVESFVALIVEHKTSIVVIQKSVDKECSVKLHVCESIFAHQNTGS